MKKTILPVLISILFLPLFSYAVSIGGTDAQGSILGGASSKPVRWTVSAEVIVFERNGTPSYDLVERVPGDVQFFSVPSTPSAPALNSTDLKQGFTPGFRMGVAYHVDTKHDLAISFFHIGDLQSSRSIGPDNPLNWLVMNAPGGFFQTQDFAYQSMQWDYSTELYNTEINAQKKISNRITVLAGFRWLQLHETLQGTIPPPDVFVPEWKFLNPTLFEVAQITTGTAAPPYPPFWNTTTMNNLYGFQIGADAKLLERGKFFVNGLIKVGGYWNHAQESTGVSISKVVYNSGASIDHAAFVSEAGVQCKYQISRALTLKFGYQMLWFSGVALAPGQIQETYSTSSPTTVTALGVNSNSDVLFHGGTAGLEFSF